MEQNLNTQLYGSFLFSLDQLNTMHFTFLYVCICDKNDWAALNDANYFENKSKIGDFVKPSFKIEMGNKSISSWKSFCWH